MAAWSTVPGTGSSPSARTASSRALRDVVQSRTCPTVTPNRWRNAASRGPSVLRNRCATALRSSSVWRRLWDVSIAIPTARLPSRTSRASRISHAPRSSRTVKSEAERFSTGSPFFTTATICSTTWASSEACSPRPFSRIERSAARPSAVFTRAVSTAGDPGTFTACAPDVAATFQRDALVPPRRA